MITQYFVEFVFYSLLGWIWESIYCTIKSKKWSNRGFLFGPVCPIYGSSVVIAHIVFSRIPMLAASDFPIGWIFVICMVGSAVMEFGTSYYLEKRFHAKWWDYSDLPLNIQGRICPQVSIAFGLAGVVIVKYILPITNEVQAVLPESLVEVLAILLAGLMGADLALTEASLSSLLKEIETYKMEFDSYAEETYTNVSQRIEKSVAKYKENAQLHSEKLRTLSTGYISRMTPPQRHMLQKIKSFDLKNKTKQYEGMTAVEYLKSVLQKMDKKRK